MEEVVHVPAGQPIRGADSCDVLVVQVPKELHANHGENEDDDGENESEVPQSAHRVPDDFNESV